MKKLFGEGKRQTCGTRKRHARQSRKRVDHQKEADFNPHQHKRQFKFGPGRWNCWSLKKQWDTALHDFGHPVIHIQRPDPVMHQIPSAVGDHEANRPHTHALGFGLLGEPIDQVCWIIRTEQSPLAAHGREIPGC